MIVYDFYRSIVNKNCFTIIKGEVAKYSNCFSRIPFWVGYIKNRKRFYVVDYKLYCTLYVNLCNSKNFLIFLWILLFSTEIKGFCKLPFWTIGTQAKLQACQYSREKSQKLTHPSVHIWSSIGMLIQLHNKVILKEAR